MMSRLDTLTDDQLDELLAALRRLHATLEHAGHPSVHRDVLYNTLCLIDKIAASLTPPLDADRNDHGHD